MNHTPPTCREVADAGRQDEEEGCEDVAELRAARDAFVAAVDAAIAVNKRKSTAARASGQRSPHTRPVPGSNLPFTVGTRGRGRVVPGINKRQATAHGVRGPATRSFDGLKRQGLRSPNIYSMRSGDPLACRWVPSPMRSSQRR